MNNPRNELERLYRFSRRSGNTTALVKAVKEGSGRIVVGNHHQAEGLIEDHGLEKSHVVAVRDVKNLYGLNVEPILWDGSVISWILEEIKSLNHLVDAHDTIVLSLRQEIIDSNQRSSDVSQENIEIRRLLRKSKEEVESLHDQLRQVTHTNSWMESLLKEHGIDPNQENS